MRGGVFVVSGEINNQGEPIITDQSDLNRVNSTNQDAAQSYISSSLSGIRQSIQYLVEHGGATGVALNLFNFNSFTICFTYDVLSTYSLERNRMGNNTNPFTVAVAQTTGNLVAAAAGTMIGQATGPLIGEGLGFVVGGIGGVIIGAAGGLLTGGTGGLVSGYVSDGISGAIAGTAQGAIVGAGIGGALGGRVGAQSGRRIGNRVGGAAGGIIGSYIYDNQKLFGEGNNRLTPKEVIGKAFRESWDTLKSEVRAEYNDIESRTSLMINKLNNNINSLFESKQNINTQNNISSLRPSYYISPNAIYNSLNPWQNNHILNNNFGIFIHSYNSPFNLPFQSFAPNRDTPIYNFLQKRTESLLKNNYGLFSLNPTYTDYLNLNKSRLYSNDISEISSLQLRDAIRYAIESELRNSPNPTGISAYMKACWALGNPGNFYYSDFINVIKSTKLIESFNGIHGICSIRALNAFLRDIGGVAARAGTIQGMKDSPDQVFMYENIFAFKTPDGKMPFTDNELKRILRELSTGIFVHQTYPFFSLHFNNDGILYPVIHPAYQNTLVGEVIGILDYFLKGFLNGGVFQKEFLNTWHEQQNTNRDFLKSKLVDIKKICKEQLSKLPYISLRELMHKYGLEGLDDEPNSEHSIYKTKFSTSFRIIAKQGNISKHDNIFLMNPEFDIEYSIDTMPDYQEYLEKYEQEHGSLPKDFVQLKLLYAEMAKDIKQKMPLLPFCRDYFQMLGVISFFCYYFTTLKEMNKAPILDKAEVTEKYESPKAYPPIPVRYYQHFKVDLKFATVINKILELEQKEGAVNTLNEYLKILIYIPELEMSQEVLNRIKNTLVHLITTQLPPEVIANDESFKVSGKYIGTIFKLIQFIFNRETAGLGEAVSQKFKQIIKGANKIYAFQVADLINEEFEDYVSDNQSVSLSTLPQRYLDIINSINSSGRVGPILNFEDIENLGGIEQKIDYLQTTLNSKRNATHSIINDWENREKQKAYDRLRAPLEPQKIAQQRSELENSITESMNEQRQQAAANFENNLSKQLAEAKITFNQLPAHIQTQINSDRQQHLQQFDAAATQHKQEVLARFDQNVTSKRNELDNHYNNLIQAIENQRQQLIASIDTNYNIDIGSLNEIQEKIANITNLLLKNENLAMLPLSNQYHHSTLGIADSDYYKEVGDNLRIVGGCGLSLPNITPSPILHGERLASQLSFHLVNKPSKSFSQIEFDGERYTTFKLGIEDRNVVSSLDYAYLIHSLSDNREDHSISDDEVKLLGKMMFNAIPGAEEKVGIDISSVNLQKADMVGQTLLHYAATFANTADLDELVKHDSSLLTRKDKHGYLPIHAAAKSGNVEAISYFIGKNPGLLEAITQNGVTPFLVAVQNGQIAVIDKLLSLGANPDYKLPNGLFALYIAIQDNNEALTLHLLQKSPEININFTTDSGSTALNLSIELGQTEVPKALVSRGADLSLRSKMNGFTPLHTAASKGNIESLEAILDTGRFAVDTPLESGKTALHLAAAEGHLEIVKLLVEKYKANINARTFGQQTPIMNAIANGQLETSYYLAHSCSINIINNSGEIASVQAAKKGMFEVADILISRGEINKHNKSSNKEGTVEVVNNTDRSQLVNRKINNLNYYFLQTGSFYRYSMLHESGKITFKPKHLQKSALGESNGLLLDYILEKHSVIIKGVDYLPFAIKLDDISYLKEWLKSNKTSDKTAKSRVEQEKTIAYIAAENGSLHCLRELLQNSKVNVANAYKDKHLLYAGIISGKAKIIKEILVHSEDNNIALDNKGNTAAHIIVQYGLLNLINTLYKHGVSFTKENQDGLSPLHIAILNDDKQIFKKILKLISKVDLPNNLLSFALSKQKSKCIEALIKQGYTDYSKEQATDELALISACKNNATTQVIKLLETGYNPNQKTSEGLAIHNAIEHSRIEIIELLLNAKSDLFLKDNQSNAIAVAIKHIRVDVIKLLFTKGYGNLIKLNIKEYLSLTDNPYIIEALHGEEARFVADKIKLIKAFKHSNARVLAPLLKQFPLSHTLFEDEDGIQKPFLHFIFNEDFNIGEAYIMSILSLIADKIDPRIKDSEDKGINFSLLKATNGDIHKKLDWISKYFGKHEQELIRQECNGKGLVELAFLLSNASLIRILEEKGILTLYRDKQEKTALHLACIYGDLETIKQLISKGIDVDLRDSRRSTPLMLAAASGNVRSLEVLVSKGANLEAQDIMQDTALHYAIKANKSYAAVYLTNLTHNIEGQNRDGFTPFMLAAAKGMLPVMQVVSHKMTNFAHVNNKGVNALHLAALHGHTEVLKWLLENGADIDAQISPKGKKKLEKSNRDTALHLVVQSNKPEALSILLKYGASITKGNTRGISAIEQAVISNQQEILRVVKQFATYHLSEQQPKLLIAAAMGNNVDIMKELIEAGCPINSIGKFSKNALHFAAINNSSNAATLLIEHGINLELVSAEGNTPLHDAAQYGSIDIIRQLSAQGVIINVRNHNMQTPLHLACKSGQYTATLQLLLAGARENMVDKDGITPGQLALINGHKKIVELLFCLGDVSIHYDSLRLLPAYMKVQYKGLMPNLEHLQSFLSPNSSLVNVNHLRLAIELNQIDAIRLLNALYPELINQVDKHGHDSIYYAKEAKNIDVLRVITECKHKILTSVNSNQSAIYQRLNYNSHSELEDNWAESMQRLLGTNKLPREAFLLYLNSLEVINEKKRSTYSAKWKELLSNLSLKPDFLKRFIDQFLIQYPWNIISSSQFFSLIEQLVSPEMEKLQLWFWKYFEPITLYRLEEKEFDHSLAVFHMFVRECANLGLQNTISSPPRICISFQLSREQNYLELCILTLKKCINKEIQVQFLDQLPNSNIAINAFNNKFLFITKQMVMHGAIHSTTKEDLKRILDYSAFKARALSYLAKDISSQFLTGMKFFEHIDRISTKELNLEEKLLIANCFINNASSIINPHKISSFVELAIQVKINLGYRIFRKLFSIIPSPQLAKFDCYLDICTLLLELKDWVKPIDLLEGNLPDLLKLHEVLEQKQLEYLHHKYPEPDLETALSRFAEISEFVKSPLSTKEIEILRKSYLAITEYAKVFRTKSLSELAQIAKEQGELLGKDPKNTSASLMLISIIREVVRHKFKIYPYNTQVLSILAITQIPEGLKGRIAQIRTGEGKSTIIAMLAVYVACQGKCVDIITSARPLAIRDQEKYEGFFRVLNISSSHICYDHPKREHFNGQVIYSTNTDLEFSILRDEFYSADLRYTQVYGKIIKRPCETVIVDEVDNLFLDTALNSARLAIPAIEDKSWVYEPIYKHVENNYDKRLNINLIREALKNCYGGKYIDQIDDFTDKQLKIWGESALIAMQKQENHDYVIRYIADRGEKEPKPTIVIVDYANTGSLNFGSRWSNGIHEFLEVKHGLKPEQESITCASISHPAFFKEYKVIYGLTGTIGEVQERQEIKEIYGVDMFDVPPHFPSQRKTLEASYSNNLVDYYKAILNDIKSVIKEQRPTLVLFNTIQETQKFSLYLAKHHIKHNLLNEVQEQDADYILSRAGHAKSVTIATNIAGRGTDILLNTNSKESGGLHVIFACYPANLRVEDQGMGRAGRQGQSGTCRMIVHSEDILLKKLIPNPLVRHSLTNFKDIFSEIGKLRSIQVEALSKRRAISSTIETINHQVLKKFCNLMQIFYKQIEQVDIKELADECQQPIYQEPLAAFNPKNSLIINLHKQAESLIQSQTQGNKVDWIPFLKIAREAYSTIVQQEWALFYSEISSSKLNNIGNYEKKLNESYDSFINTKMQPVFDDCIVYFKSYIMYLLTNIFNHRSHSKPFTVTNSLEAIEDELTSRKFCKDQQVTRMLSVITNLSFKAYLRDEESFAVDALYDITNNTNFIDRINILSQKYELMFSKIFLESRTFIAFENINDLKIADLVTKIFRFNSHSYEKEGGIKAV